MAFERNVLLENFFGSLKRLYDKLFLCYKSAIFSFSNRFVLSKVFATLWTMYLVVKRIVFIKTVHSIFISLTNFFCFIFNCSRKYLFF